VAVLPEARGRGFGKALLRALLEEGRSQQHAFAGIMVINGNDVVRHTYESVGFKPYQTFYADYFWDQFNIEFPGITKYRNGGQGSWGQLLGCLVIYGGNVGNPCVYQSV
jgi:ribosomal protein S18 acetylase RimI-like enzyme